MSIESERKAMEFREWKEDLELRADMYVVNAIMTEKKKPVATPAHVDPAIEAPLPTIGQGDRIEVKQSVIDPAVWRVEYNGELYQVFSGIDAHGRALRYVNDALNRP